MQMGSRSSFDDFSDDQSFLRMISAMMYTFGDVKEPLEESVQVVYAILREQMDILLKDAEGVARFRRSSHISHEDILFLLRKHTAKLKQLLQYLDVLDLKPKLLLDVKVSGDDILLPERKKTRVNMCLEYFAHIQDCEEFTTILKDKSVPLPMFAKKRLERRNWMVEKMTPNEYKEFAETLQGTFCPVHNAMEFERWLLRNQATNFCLTPLALTIIGFLVRELIAEIVEMALEIKLRKWEKLMGAEFDCITKNNVVYKYHYRYGSYIPNVSRKEIDIVIKYIEKYKDLSTDVSEKKNKQICPVHSKDDATKIKQNNLKDKVTNMDVSPHEESECFFSKQLSSNCSDSDDSNYIIIESTSESVNEDSRSQDIVHENSDSAAIESTQNIDLAPMRSSFTDATKKDLNLSSLKHTKEAEAHATDNNELHELKDISECESEKSNLSETEKLHQEPIEPVEIREAYVHFCEPLPLTNFFTDYPRHRKKKLYLGGWNPLPDE